MRLVFSASAMSPVFSAAAAELGFSAAAAEPGFSAAAMPPDVRRGSASPPVLLTDLGLRPWFGLCPTLVRAEPEPGAQPNENYSIDGEAEPRLTSGGGAEAVGFKDPRE